MDASADVLQAAAAFGHWKETAKEGRRHSSDFLITNWELLNPF